MKKIITYSAIAAIALAAVSCTKEEMNPESAQPALKQITITVSAAEDATKSSLDGTKTINWEAGDQIGVWDGTAIRIFTTEGSGSSAKFTGTVDAGATELYAKYPYVSTDSWASGVVTTSIPTVQTAVTGSFAKGANVAVAKAVINGTDTTFAMKNVCSYFKFTLANGDRKVKSVTLSAQKDRTQENTLAAMTGGVSITVSDTPTAASANPPYYSATLTTDDVLGLSEGDYYIAILPQTYADGISLTFTSTDGMTAFLRKSSSLTFERNTPSSFSSSIHTSSSLNWKETEVLVLDFAGTKSKGGPFTTELLSPVDTGAVTTYYLDQNGTTYTFVAKGYMQYTSSYGFALLCGSYNYPGSTKKQGANLQYLKLPAISGKRLASVEMTPTGNSRQGYAAVCEDEVGDSWTILSNSNSTQIRYRKDDFGWYDLKTTANTSYRIGNTGTKPYGTTAYFNVNKITLTYVGGDAPTPAPNLTLNFAGNILTASVDQAGSTVYYETSTTSMEDVPTPTTSSAVLPSDGLNLAGSITYVKAIAVKGDKSSDVKEITCDGTKAVFGSSWDFTDSTVGSGTFYSEFLTYCESIGGISKFVNNSTFTSQNLTIKNTKDDSGSFSNTTSYLKYNKDVPGLVFTFKSASAGKGKLSVKLNARSSGSTTYIRFYDSTVEGGYKQESVVYNSSVPTTTYSYSVTEGQEIKFSTGKCLLYNISWEEDTTE